MGRPNKTEQAAVDGARRLALTRLVDLQTTGRRLLHLAASWSHPEPAPDQPYCFIPVPDYLLLIEVTLADPAAPGHLHKALDRLVNDGLIQAHPMAYEGHVDFAYRRPTGEVLYVQVSPEDAEATASIYTNWPVPNTTQPLDRYVIPLEEMGQHLGIGYRVTPSGIDAVQRPANQLTSAPANPTSTLTPKQVASKYNMDIERVYSLIRSGELPAMNLAKSKSSKPRYVIRQQDLEAFEAQRAVAPPAPQPRRRSKPRDDDVIKFF